MWTRPFIAAAAAFAVTGFGARVRDRRSPTMPVDSSSSRSVLEGVYSAAQAARGDALYRLQCASCHGADMSAGDTGPALAGAKFIGNWRGQSLSDLADKIFTTMPPDDPATLQKQDVADLIASILSANRYPAGGAPLDASSVGLRQIRIDSPAR